MVSLSNIEFPLLAKLKIPVSKPSKFLILGLRLLFIPFSSVTLLLKKLSTSLSGAEITAPFIPVLSVTILSWSPGIPTSPSKAAKAILAFTGSGDGTVLKPDTEISGDLFTPTTEKPSKRVILRLSLLVSS